MLRFFSKLTLIKSLQLKHAVIAYVTAAMVVNPAMAHQQSAALIKQQQARVIAEKLSVDRQSAAQLAIQLADSDTALKEAMNGTTVVDIATPSAKGVSKNNWNEFNVDENGIIFNNSKGPVLTQLGGWSDGNRRLAGGEATIIVNQVNGSNRSSLLGQVEIAGKAAEFILANPNGISCNGCGFINTPSVSLVTGNSRFNSNGDLIFDITQGDFLLEGAGLNASNINRFDIVSRYARINADLYANELNLITGTNQFNYNTKEISGQTSNSNPNLQFALDSTALGGMYANRIQLIGTEKGLGINLEGLVQSTDELFISADGNIQLKQAQANNNLKIKSQSGDITNKEFIYARSAELSAANSVINQGLLAANDSIRLDGKNIIQAGGLYAGLTEQNQLNTTASLEINADTVFDNQKDIYVGGALHLHTATLNNSGNFVIQTQDNLAIDQLHNSGSIRFHSANATISSLELLNTSGDIQHLGSGLFTLNAETINNQSGLLATNGSLKVSGSNLLNNNGEIFASHFDATLGSLDNSQGVIEIDSINLQAGKLLNQSGRLILQGNTDNSINIAEEFNNQSGVFYADAQTVVLKAKSFDNQQGNFILNNAGLADIAIKNINNQSGFFQTNDLLLDSEIFNNTQGEWLAGNNQSSIDSIINDQGFIQATHISLDGKTLDNNAGVVLQKGSSQAQAMNLNVDTAVANTNKGVIRNLGGDTTIVTGELNNSNNGVIETHGKLDLQLKQLVNQDGSLQSDALQIHAETVDNQSGHIQSTSLVATVAGDWNNTGAYVEAGNLQLTTSNLDNQQGYLLSTSDTQIQLSGKLSNQQGVIANQGNENAEIFSITAHELNNSGEIISEAKKTTIKLDDQLINTGVILANLLQLSGSELVNAGHISSLSTTSNVDSLVLDFVQRITNTGQVSVNSDWSMVTNDLSNQGRIESTGKGSITAGSITNIDQQKQNSNHANTNAANDKGLISANSLVINSGSINNQFGILLAGDALDIKHTESISLNNQSGFIQSNATDWQLKNIELNNAGGTLWHSGGGNAEFWLLNHLDNSGGSITSAGNLTIDLQTSDSQLTNNAGLINANRLAINTNQLISNTNTGYLVGNQVTLKSKTIANKGGVIEVLPNSDAQLSLNADIINNTDQGEIRSGADNWNLSLSQLNNDGGSIIHTGAGTLNITSNNQFINKGNLFSNNQLILDVDSLINNHQISAKNIDLITSKGITNSLDGRIYAFDQMFINAQNQSINNQGEWFWGNELKDTSRLNASEWNNAGRLIIGDATSATDTRLNLHSFINTGVVSYNNLGSLTIEADKISNNRSNGENTGLIQILNDKDFSITATSLNNTEGVIAKDGEGSVILKINQLQNTDGLIATEKSVLSITSDKIINQRSSDHSNNDNQLMRGIYASTIDLSADSLDNKSGIISIHAIAASGKDNKIELNKFDNTKGILQLSNPNQDPEKLASLTLIAREEINNTDGSIQLINPTQNSSNENENDKFISSETNSLDLTTGLLINDGGVITSGGNLIINSQDKNGSRTQFTNAGDLQALNELRINAAGLTNTSRIIGGNQLSLNLDNFTLTNIASDATIFSFRGMEVNADQILNQKTIFAEETMDIAAKSFIDVGTIGSGGALTIGIESDLVVKEGETIAAPGALTITTPGKIENAGNISASNQLVLNASNLINDTSGEILAGAGEKESRFTISQHLINRGLISSQGDLFIVTPDFLNEKTGRIVTGIYERGDEALAGNLLFNVNPSIEIDPSISFSFADDATTLGNIDPENNLGSFTNEGAIYSRGHFVIENANSVINKDSAVLMSMGNMKINANTLANQNARIESDGALEFNINQSLLNLSDQLTITSTKISGEYEGSVSDPSDPLYQQVAKEGYYILHSKKINELNTSKIYSKGSMVIQGNAIIENIYSNIYSNGNLHLDGDALKNSVFEEGFYKEIIQVYSSPGTRVCPQDSSCYQLNAYHWNATPNPDSAKIYLPTGIFGSIKAAGNITGKFEKEITNGTNTTLPCDPSKDIFCSAESPKEFEPDDKFLQSLKGMAGPDSLEYFGVVPEAAGIAPKSIDDLPSQDAADGSGATAQNINPTDESVDTDLLNNADATSEQLTQDIPETIAKAIEQQLKTNQWPLISFTVLPFNFDLNNLSGLYVVNKNPESKYLIETRPEFTLYERFIGSDYLLDALGYNADKTVKRLGDAFFENMLIRDALIKETNSRYLVDTASDYDTMQKLMQNAVDAASSLQLTIGVALTPEQCASLTHDMMWLVKKNINGEEVLVPHLYLTSVSPDKIAASKAAIGANGSVNLTANKIDNQNNIYASGNLSLTADLLRNTSSLQAGNNLQLVTRGDLQQDGRLFAQGDVRLLAAGAITNNGSVSGQSIFALAQGDITNTAHNNFTAQQNLLLQSTLGNVVNQNLASLKANNLTLDAGKNVDITGNLAATNNLSLIAGEDVLLRAIKTETPTTGKNLTANTVNYTTSNLFAGGNLLVDAGKNLQAEGTDFTAGGHVTLRAGKDINLLAMENEDNYEYKAKRKHEIHKTLTNDVVNINSGGNVIIDAGQDANLTGTNIAANDNVFISATRDTNITAVVDSDYDYSYSKKKKSFGRSKTKIDETLVEDVVGGTIFAGGNVLINSFIDENDNIGLTASRNVNLNGVVIASNAGDVVVAAKEDVTLGTVEVNSIDYHLRKKSGLGGLTGKSKAGTTNSSEQAGSQIHSGNDAIILAGSDANLISAVVATKGDIQIDAGLIDEEGDINLLTAANSYFEEQKKSKKSMSLKIDKDGMTFDKTTKNANDNDNIFRLGTLLSAGCDDENICSGDINLSTKRDINVESSSLYGKNITADAGRDVNLFAAQDSSNVGKEHSESRNGIKHSDNSNGVSTFVGETTNRDRLEQRDKVSIATAFNSSENTIITAGRDITLAGAEINSEKSIKLDAKRHVTVGVSNDAYQQVNEHENIKDGLTVTANHNLGNTAKAFESLGDMGGNGVNDASTAMRAVDAISNAGPSASAHLGRTSISQKQTDTNAVAIGSKLNAGEDIEIIAGETATVFGSEVKAKRTISVDATDINILASENETDSKSKDSYHKTGVDVNASGGNVSITAGFTMSSNELKTRDITANASLLDAENISLTAKNDINVKGSDLKATENIDLDAGRNVNITSAEEYTRSEFDAEYKSFNAGVNFGAGGVGVTVNGSIGEEELDRTNITHRNSQINAGGKLSITSGNDTTIKGANVTGKDVDVNVGNNLTIASEQNTGNVKGHKYDASFSLTVGAGVSGSLSAGYGETEGSSAWTANQTSLTGSNSINVKVKNHTQLDGAVLGNIKEDGTDGNNFNLTTKTFGFSDLKDHDKEKSTYVGVSFGYGSGENSSGQTETSTSFGIDAQYSSHNKKQNTFATLGNGNITIQSDIENGTDSLAGLNRDVTQSQIITKDKSRNYDVYVNSSTIETLTDDSKRAQLVDRMTSPGRIVGEAFQFGQIIDGLDNALATIKDGEIKAPTKDQLKGLSQEEQKQVWAQYNEDKENQGVIKTSSMKEFDGKVGSLASAAQEWTFHLNEKGKVALLGMGEGNDFKLIYDKQEFARTEVAPARSNLGVVNNKDLKYDGVDFINNATDLSVEENQIAARILVSSIVGKDTETLLYTDAQESGAPGQAKGVAQDANDKPKIAGVNVSKTNIKNNLDFVATIAEEADHLRSDDDINSNIYARAFTRHWNDMDVDEDRKTGGKFNVSHKDWLAGNANNRTLLENNDRVGKMDIKDLHFRQLSGIEANKIIEIADKQSNGDANEAAEWRKRLTNQALRQIDSNHYASIAEDSEARQLLGGKSSGQTDETFTDVDGTTRSMFYAQGDEFKNSQIGKLDAGNDIVTVDLYREAGNVKSLTELLQTPRNAPNDALPEEKYLPDHIQWMNKCKAQGNGGCDMANYVQAAAAEQYFADLNNPKPTLKQPSCDDEICFEIEKQKAIYRKQAEFLSSVGQGADLAANVFNPIYGGYQTAEAASSYFADENNANALAQWAEENPGLAAAGAGTALIATCAVVSTKCRGLITKPVKGSKDDATETAAKAKEVPSIGNTSTTKNVPYNTENFGEVCQAAVCARAKVDLIPEFRLSSKDLEELEQASEILQNFKVNPYLVSNGTEKFDVYRVQKLFANEGLNFSTAPLNVPNLGNAPVGSYGIIYRDANGYPTHIDYGRVLPNGKVFIYDAANNSRRDHTNLDYKNITIHKIVRTQQ